MTGVNSCFSASQGSERLCDGRFRAGPQTGDIREPVAVGCMIGRQLVTGKSLILDISILPVK